MSLTSVPIERLKNKLYPSVDWSIIRPFIPGSEVRCKNIIRHVMALKEHDVHTVLKSIMQSFGEDHRHLENIMPRHYEHVQHYNDEKNISNERKLLIGAYFSQEYALQSAALFNPSIIIHPEQNEENEESIRFILSMRAVGEGHISSVVFRQGIITKDYDVKLRKPSRYITTPENIEAFEINNKEKLNEKLLEINSYNEFSKAVLEKLPQQYDLGALTNQIQMVTASYDNKEDAALTGKDMINLSFSNFKVKFNTEIPLSEKAIFPFCSIQSGGIEDVRFVKFMEDDGNSTYYGTYTAYNGREIQPQLIETKDFSSFDFFSLYGKAARNKGTALFPKKINGQYAMISRQDNENIFIMFSDKLHVWEEYSLLLKPKYNWEFVQIGNCGSPIEIDEGWLVLSHGVGACREYSIGVFLLDKKDPRKVLGRLKEPLIKPNIHERDGYVPNVVYTCGAIKIDHMLIIPYTMSDYVTGFARVKIHDILEALV